MLVLSGGLALPRQGTQSALLNEDSTTGEIGRNASLERAARGSATTLLSSTDDASPPCSTHTTAVMFTQQWRNEPNQPKPNRRVPDNAASWQSFFEAVNAFTANADVYICADRQDTGIVKGLERVQGVHVADDHLQPGEEAEIGRWWQWWRTQHCWDLVRQREKECDKQYTAAARLRSDVAVDSALPLSELLQPYRWSHDTTRECLMISDWTFAASPLAMDLLADTFRRIPQLSANLTRYEPIDLHAVLSSDLHAGRFRWLRLPRHALGVEDCAAIPDDFDLRAAIFRGVSDGGWEATDDTCSLINTSWIGEFSSERGMLLQLLTHGIAAKRFPARVQFKRLWGVDEAWHPNDDLRASDRVELAEGQLLYEGYTE